MNIALIISNYPADQNVKKQLGNLPENITLYEFDKRCIELDHIDKEIKADVFVFATIHQSKQGNPCLTCHAPGNWNKAEDGGEEKTLNVAPANYLKAFYLALKEKSPIEVTFEVTHHGPTLDKPCMFVEIGSSEKEWNDEALGKVIADCIKEVFSQEPKEEQSVLIIGGGHYNQVAMKIMERTEYAVGHVCPKYSLPDLNEAMLQQAIEKTDPKVSLIVVDWKGLGQEKEKVKQLLDNCKVPWKKSKEIY